MRKIIFYYTNPSVITYVKLFRGRKTFYLLRGQLMFNTISDLPFVKRNLHVFLQNKDLSPRQQRRYQCYLRQQSSPPWTPKERLKSSFLAAAATKRGVIKICRFLINVVNVENCRKCYKLQKITLRRKYKSKIYTDYWL